MRLWRPAEFNWLCVCCHVQTLNEPTELVDIATCMAYLREQFQLSDEILPNVMLGLLLFTEQELALFGNWDIFDDDSSAQSFGEPRLNPEPALDDLELITELVA